MLRSLVLTVVACGGCRASRVPTLGATDPVGASPEAGAAAEPPESDLAARLGSEKDWTSSSVRPVVLEVGSGLPSEQVRRIVRQNTGRFRLCYDEGLRRDPELAGRVDVVFRVDPSGVVGHTRDDGSTLGDPRVVACVLRAFSPIPFPPPEQGDVEVRCSLSFLPGGRRLPDSSE